MVPGCLKWALLLLVPLASPLPLTTVGRLPPPPSDDVLLQSCPPGSVVSPLFIRAWQAYYEDQEEHEEAGEEQS